MSSEYRQGQIVDNYSYENELRGRLFSTTLDARDLGDLRFSVGKVLHDLREEYGLARTGLVSGKIGAILPEDEHRNRLILKSHTDRLRVMLRGVLIFSSSDIFSTKNNLYSVVTADMSRERARFELCNFWSEMIKDGKVTDLFLTPGWENSEGANIEKKAAEENGCNIYFPDNRSDLIVDFSDL